jgi:hypothetical protein
VPGSATRLTTCRWSGNSVSSHDIDSPTWRDVEAAINLLDGNEVNDVYIYPDRDCLDTVMVIGGGPDGYIVATTLAETRHFALTRLVRCCDGMTPVMVGGQVGDYPHHLVVGKSAVLEAAKNLYETGAIETGIGWEEI